jgi:hypothetical protein
MAADAYAISAASAAGDVRFKVLNMLNATQEYSRLDDKVVIGAKPRAFSIAERNCAVSSHAKMADPRCGHKVPTIAAPACPGFCPAYTKYPKSALPFNSPYFISGLVWLCSGGPTGRGTRGWRPRSRSLAAG